MKFAELSDRAKERARDKWRESVFTNSSDWEHVYDDAANVALAVGLEIGTRNVKLMSGESASELDINFRGFCSQGDGACWAGLVDVAKLKDATTAVKLYAGEDDDLYEFAQWGENIYAEIMAYAVARRLSDDPEDDPYPGCEATMKIRVDSNDHHGFITRIVDDDVPEEIAKSLNRYVEWFASWIYGQLESEHDRQTDSDVIDENILANDYEFDEEGYMT